MPPSLTLAAVQNLISEQTKTLVDEIKNLRTEVATLRASLDAVQNRPPSPSNPDGNQPVLASVVKASVQSALQEECVKRDVVMNLRENKRDMEDVNDLCQKAQINVKPSSIIRLGKPKNDRTRPLKASFPTPFDARTFMAKVEAYRKTVGTDETLAKVRCRPCRTREEQTRYAAIREQVHQLNEAAKDGGVESYSVRTNGAVWKFVKKNEKWVRDSEWTFTPSTSESTSSASENDARTPRF